MLRPGVSQLVSPSGESGSGSGVGGLGVGAASDEDEHCAILGAHAVGLVTEPAQSALLY